MIATGETHSVEELVSCAFDRVGLDPARVRPRRRDPAAREGAAARPRRRPDEGARAARLGADARLRGARRAARGRGSRARQGRGSRRPRPRSAAARLTLRRLLAPRALLAAGAIVAALAVAIAAAEGLSPRLSRRDGADHAAVGGAPRRRGGRAPVGRADAPVRRGTRPCDRGRAPCGGAGSRRCRGDGDPGRPRRLVDAAGRPRGRAHLLGRGEERRARRPAPVPRCGPPRAQRPPPARTRPVLRSLRRRRGVARDQGRAGPPDGARGDPRLPPRSARLVARLEPGGRGTHGPRAVDGVRHADDDGGALLSGVRHPGLGRCRDAGAADVAAAGGHAGARRRCRPDQAPGVRAAAGDRDRDRGVRRDLEPATAAAPLRRSRSAASAR